MQYHSLVPNKYASFFILCFSLPSETLWTGLSWLSLILLVHKYVQGWGGNSCILCIWTWRPRRSSPGKGCFIYKSGSPQQHCCDVLKPPVPHAGYLHLNVTSMSCGLDQHVYVPQLVGGTKWEVALKLWKCKGGRKSALLHCCPVSPYCCRLTFV